MYWIQIFTSIIFNFVPEVTLKSEGTENVRKLLKVAENGNACVQSSVHHSQCRVVSVEMSASSLGLSFNLLSKETLQKGSNGLH